MGQIHDALKPHRPLDPNDPGYVARPDGAERLVQALQLAPLVGVVGPVGVGKSTELSAAVARLRAMGRQAFHVPLDRQFNMRALTVDQLYIGLATPLRGPVSSTSTTFRNELLQGLRSVQRPVLVVDGLEKVTDPERGRDLLDALGELTGEADVIAVLPWYAAYGPTAGRVMGEQERVVALRAVDGKAQAGFLRHMLINRAPVAAFALSVDDAARWSGGVPRTFLQLAADAIVYGTGSAGLERAVREQQDSIRRALMPGDVAAIRAAAGTDGREIELERRIRLLASGLLLERDRNGIVVEPHPLLDGLLG